MENTIEQSLKKMNIYPSDDPRTRIMVNIFGQSALWLKDKKAKFGISPARTIDMLIEAEIRRERGGQ